MTAEFPQPSAPEARDLSTPEGYFYELFDRTRAMVQYEKQGKLVAEITPQEIHNWYSYNDYGRKYTEGIELEKGLLYASSRYNFAVSIGKRYERYVGRVLSVEFGVAPNVDGDFERTLGIGIHPPEESREQRILNYLKGITNQYGFAYGSGRVYWDGKVRTDCWTDGYPFGGPELGRWEGNRALSEAGVITGVDLFRQLSERAWR